MKIVPSNITYLFAQFEVLVYFHNLNNGDINLIGLKAETSYSFYLNFSKNQEANISLEINDKNKKPFKYITIYEIGDNSYS